ATNGCLFVMEITFFRAAEHSPSWGRDTPLLAPRRWHMALCCPPYNTVDWEKELRDRYRYTGRAEGSVSRVRTERRRSGTHRYNTSGTHDRTGRCYMA